MKKTEMKGLTLEQAYRIMGERIIDVNGVDRILGLIPKDLHPIPFTEWELEVHANEDHRLYLELSHTDDNQPLNIDALAKMACRKKGNRISPNEYLFWPVQFNDDGTVKLEAWFYGDRLVMSATPKLGWHIASEEVIPKTLYRNYIDQTDALIDYHKKLYRGHLPEHYNQAIDQWDRKRLTLKEMLRNENKQVLCQELVKAKIISLVRESYMSTAYRHALIYEIERRNILQENWNWSNTATSNSDLMAFGRAGAVGAFVLRFYNEYESSFRGAVFSRSGNIED